MLLICVPMMRGHKHGQEDSTVSKEEVAALREELAQLRGQQSSGSASEPSDNREPVR